LDPWHELAYQSLIIRQEQVGVSLRSASKMNRVWGRQALRTSDLRIAICRSEVERHDLRDNTFKCVSRFVGKTGVAQAINSCEHFPECKRRGQELIVALLHSQTDRIYTFGKMWIVF